MFQQQILRSIRSRLWEMSVANIRIPTHMCFLTNSKSKILCITVSFHSAITNGTVCLFSLKNPSYPEWICVTESPVMCLDFNTQHPHLLVIGNKINVEHFCLHIYLVLEIQTIY